MNNIALVTNISATQVFLIALITGLAIISWIYTFMFSMRALIMAALIGAILGHAKEAIIFGAAAELVYLGLINAAGVVPPNPIGPGVLGTIILLTSPGVGVGTAIALSLPFAIFIQFMITVIFTINSPIGKIGEKFLRNDRWLLYKISGHSTGISLFILGFAVGLAGGLGYEAFGRAISKIPDWLQNGLSVGGRMLPAMGFAIILRLMLKKEYTPFLLVGFSLLVIFVGIGAAVPAWGFSYIALTIAAAAIAFIVFYSGILSKSEKRRREVAPVLGDDDGI